MFTMKLNWLFTSGLLPEVKLSGLCLYAFSDNSVPFRLIINANEIGEGIDVKMFCHDDERRVEQFKAFN